MLLMLAAALLLAFGAPAMAQDGEVYRLGPQDQIAVRVALWDVDTGRYADWPTLSGDYTVGVEGGVSLPVVGVLAAAGLTPAELAARLADAVARKISPVEPPGVSVAVARYRPLYVIGDVQRSGAYAYEPGLTVIKAIALAGGVRSASAPLGDETQIARNLGSLRGVRLDLARLKARAFRLEAELAGKETLVFPPDIGHPDGPAATTIMLGEERALFETRREALRRGLEAVSDLRRLLQTEIDMLRAKLSGQEEQVEMMRKAVGNIETLFEKGLARVQNVTGLQSSLIDLENKGLDLEIGMFRARRNVAEADRDAMDLRTRRDLEAATELQRARAEIEQLDERERTLLRLIAVYGIDGVTASASDIAPRFTIAREDNGRTIEFEAGRHDRVRPSDVLSVALSLAAPPAGGVD